MTMVLWSTFVIREGWYVAVWHLPILKIRHQSWWSQSSTGTVSTAKAVFRFRLRSPHRWSSIGIIQALIGPPQWCYSTIYAWLLLLILSFHYAGDLDVGLNKTYHSQPIRTKSELVHERPALMVAELLMINVRDNENMTKIVNDVPFQYKALLCCWFF